jgi:hypothetical protein
MIAARVRGRGLRRRWSWAHEGEAKGKQRQGAAMRGKDEGAVGLMRRT